MVMHFLIYFFSLVGICFEMDASMSCEMVNMFFCLWALGGHDT
jgi:hypothetical protein